MTKLFSRATVTGTSLSGANLKAALTTLWDALQSIGVTDATRTTVTASATLTMSQCGILLVDCSSGSVVLTLPTSGSSSDEAQFRIRRIDSTYTNTLTVQRGGTDTVEGGTSAVAIGPGGQVELKLPGGSTDWRVLGRSGGTALAAREAIDVPAVNFLDNPDGAVYQRAVGAQADDNYADDRWYVLTQSGSITPSPASYPEAGYESFLRLTQSQASAQRFGRAQIIPAERVKQLRGQVLTVGGRLQLSTSANLRMALLAWSGTADTLTSDVVADWTSGSYTAGGFFNSTTLAVVATASKAMTAGAAASMSVTGTVPTNATNLIVFYWTEATAAQNVTLDAWGMRAILGTSLTEYIRREYGEELRRCMRWCEAYAGPGVYLVKARESDRARRCSVQFKVKKASSPSAVNITSSNADGGGSITGTADVDGATFSNLATADAQLPNVSAFIVSCDL